MAELLIGCPIQKREWILEEWFRVTEIAAAGIDHSYLFVMDCDERPLVDIMDATGLPIDRIHVNEIDREDSRHWNHTRYHHMVDLRNLLLGGVRNARPNYFLSLDSDILVHPDGIKRLLWDIQENPYHAVGGKCYMTPKGVQFPSYALLDKKDRLRRPESDLLMEVDVIMAMKLMGPKAYNVDYEWHRKGEDIGWSKAAKNAHCTLAWDGTLVNRHVMGPKFLKMEDGRCSPV